MANETLRAELELRLAQEEEHGADPERIEAIKAQLAEIGEPADDTAGVSDLETDDELEDEPAKYDQGDI